MYATGARRSTGRRSVSRTSFHRRKRIWARDEFFTSLTAPTSTGVDLLQGFKNDYGADPIGVTITAIRGNIGASYGGVDPGPGGYGRVVFGCKVTDAANATGSVSPATDDVYDDWMYWEGFYCRLLNEPGATGTMREENIPIYVRSQRKLDEIGQSLQMCVEVPGENIITVFWNLSILLLLP